MAKREKSPWSKTFESIRDEISDDFFARGLQGDKRLEFLLEQVEVLSSEQDEVSKVRGFAYAQHIIHHQLKYGGLLDRQLQEVIDYAQSLVQMTSELPDKDDPLRQRQAEINILVSQWERSRGQHFDAACQQAIAYDIAGKKMPGGADFHQLTMGNRLLRMGLTQAAKEQYSRVDPDKLGESNRRQLFAGLCQAEFFLGNPANVEKSIQLLRTCDESIYADFYQELFLGDLSDVRRLVAFTAKHKNDLSDLTHLEVYLLARAHDLEDNFFRRLAKPRRIVRSEFERSIDRRFHAAVCALDDAFQGKTTGIDSLNKVAVVCGRAGEYLTVAHEILYDAATASWAKHTEFGEFQSFIAARYAQISRMVSEGASDDIYRIG